MKPSNEIQKITVLSREVMCLASFCFVLSCFGLLCCVVLFCVVYCICRFSVSNNRLPIKLAKKRANYEVVWGVGEEFKVT